MNKDNRTDIFEAARPQLLGLAYRLLGSTSDAQDAVQDTCIKWLSYDGPVLDSPPAWFSRVCTNLCLDQLKSAHRKRVDYVGPWIPDQLQTEFEGSEEDQFAIASSLSTAFLLLLERLTPKERAAYLLHDIFEKPFDEVAEILGIQQTNCRKLATRARKYIVESDVRHVPIKQRQNDLLGAFQNALHTGDTAVLAKMLREDSDLRADSDGKVIALREVLEGRESVCLFIARVLSNAWYHMLVVPTMLNGTLGLLVGENEGMHAAISFAYDAEDRVKHIYILRHPDKLTQLAASKGLVSGMGSLTLN